jgi:uncharacterized protein YjbJ (UPF0337 family)
MVDKDRVEGSANKIGGDIKEAAGKALGDSKLEAEGKAQKAQGKAQNFWGGLKDMFRGDRTDDRGRPT